MAKKQTVNSKSHPKTYRYRKKMNQLVAERDTWDGQYRDIQEYLFPDKGRYLQSNNEAANDGKKRNQSIVNDTPEKALNTLGAGLQGGMTSPSRPWLKLTLANKDLLDFPAVKEYLTIVRDRMLIVLQKSNFYGSIHSVYTELGSFGTAAMLMEEDFDTIVRFRPYTVGEYYLSLDKLFRPDTLYRRYSMSADQMVAEFGEENLSRSAAEAHNDGAGETTFTIIHAIQPRDDRDAGRMDTSSMPYESVYYEESTDNDKILRESGYHGIPFVAPRWALVSGCDTYGRGPGMQARGDAKELRKLEISSLQALDKVINPPMNAPSSMREAGGGSIIAGNVNYVDPMQGGQSFTPAYQINPDIGAVEAKIQRVEERINETFHKNLFLSVIGEDKTMTAREVIERSSERMQILGPVVDRVQSETFDRIIDRLYDVMNSRGELPPPPPELEGMDIQPEYISILAQAQKMVGLTAMDQLVGTVGSWAQLNPEVLDKIDFDEAIDEYSESIGTAPAIIKPTEEADQARAQRAQAQAQQQQAAAAVQAADSAKTMSETPVDQEGNTALQALMGTGAGG